MWFLSDKRETPPAVCCLFTENLSDNHKCDCASKQYEWFIFNHEVVVPEYVVDFEYVTSVR